MIAGLNGLVYHDEDHRYMLPDRRILSVTDILKSEGLIELDWMTEAARWRGKVTHHGCRLMLKKTLNWETVHPEIAGFIHSLELFLAASGFLVMGFEEPLHHPSLLYGGMPDLWGILNGAWTVIDYKTGPVQPWCAFQTALYVMALIEHQTLLPAPLKMPMPGSFYLWKRFGLRLMADGSVSKLIPFPDMNDYGLAASLVSIANWKLNNNYDLWRQNG